jgi:hypothetical protein
VSRIWLLSLLSFAIATSTVVALPRTAAAQGDLISSIADAPWQAEVTPDLWVLGLQSTDRLGPRTVSGNLSFGSIVRDLRAVALGDVVVKKGPIFVLADITYAHVGLRPNVPQLQSDSLSLQGTWATVGAGYAFRPIRLAGRGPRALTLQLRGMAGAAYTGVDVELRPPGGQPDLAKLAPAWWTPVVGARADLRSGPYGLQLSGYSGDFLNSRRGDQAFAALTYTLDKPRFFSPTFGAGYRYLFAKRTLSDVAIVRTTLQGPIVFVTFHFG